MEKLSKETQKNLNKIVVVMKWLALGGTLEIGDARYAFDESGSLCFQFKTARPEEDPWYSAESLSANYFFNKLVELPENTIVGIKMDLSLMIRG